MKYLLLSLVAVAGPLAAGQHSGSVRAADQWIPGATVTAVQGGAKLVTATDDTGRYSLELTPGVWRLKVEMFGFVTAERDVEMAMDGSPTVWDWTLEMKRLAPPAPVVDTAAAGAGAPEIAAAQAGAAPTPPPVAAPAKTLVKARRPAPGQAGPGFQSVTLNATPEAAGVQSTAEAEAAPEPANESGSAEAFLVSGSVSRGLEDARRDDERQSRHGSDDRGDRGDSGAGSFGGGAAPSSLAALFGGDAGGSGFGGSGSSKRGASGISSKSLRGSKKSSTSKQRRVTSFGNRKRDNDGMHGSVYVSLRNSALDARQYSLTGQPVSKPSYARSYMGASVGGPLQIPKVLTLDRTFVFFTYQGVRSRNPYNRVDTLPTALERGGDFSQSVARWPVQIFDPTNQLPFPRNVIPKSRFDPAAVGLINFMPLPNLPGRVQNYQYTTSYGNNTDNYSLRVTQPFSRRDRINVSFNRQHRDSFNPQVYGFLDNSQGSGFSSSAGYSHTFGPRFINNLTWNFSRNLNQTLPYFAYSSNVADQLGIAGTSDEPINYGPPNLSFTNFGGLVDASAVLRRDQASSINEGLTAVLKKKHNLAFGFGYRRLQLNSRAYQNARGSFSFSGLMTSAFDDKGQPLAGTGYDFADFLLGMPQSSSIRFGSENTYFRASAWNFYANDDWRPRHGLTLNVGLRYEYFTPYRELYGRMANLDVNPTFTGVAVVTPGASGTYSGTFGDGLVDPDKNNFSPRAGVAWRPFQKKSTLIRAGYGVFYNGSVYGQFPSRMASQPPFATSASLTTSNARRLSLTNGFAEAPSTTITNSYAVNRNYKVGYAQTFNLAIQHSLPHALVLEAGYMGTKGTHLDIQRLPNRAAPGSPLTAEQRRQIGNAVGFTYEDSNGNSILHSAQLRLTRRFQKGVSLNALYTYAKSIDNVSTFGGGGTTVAQNDKDLHAERGLSSFDQRHNLATTFVLASPVGRGGFLRNGGWRAKLLADWTASGTTVFTSGTPLTARVLGNLANSGGTGSVGSGRADAAGTVGVQDGDYRFFNLAAFVIPPAGRYGNAGRNTIPGPSRFSINASLGRNFRLGDTRRSIDLRCDSINSLNHVAFSSIGTVINASNYGLPLATLPMRSVTMSLRFRF